MSNQQSQIIKEKIQGYNLMDILETRLQIIIVDGVGKTTIYKAFRVGPITPTLRQILDAAEALIKEHEAKIAVMLEESRLNLAT